MRHTGDRTHRSWKGCRPFLLAILICFCALTVGAGGLASGGELDPVHLRSLVDQIVARQMDEYRVPGVTLSIVKDGEAALAVGYGYADLENEVPVDPALTLFRPGSISKLLTWTAVMQLVEQDMLDPDADINTYLDFQIPDRILGCKTTTPQPITMRHLMTHTPGFEDVLEDLFVLTPDRMISLESYLRRHVPARIFPAGEVLAYSNYGAALAGYIVERVSGQPFAEYVEEHIFAPLGMVNSTFRQPLPDHLAPNMAIGYKFFEGQFYQGDFEYISMAPAGSMSTTASDMARFMIAHLDEGRYGDQRILMPQTVRLMHSQQYTQHDRLNGVTHGFFEDTIQGRRVIGHNANTMLFYSHLLLFPEERLGLFASYSGGSDPSEVIRLPEKLLREIIAEYYPGAQVSLPEPPLDARERAGSYLGEYHPTRMTHTGPLKLIGIMQAVGLDLTEEGFLRARAMGQSFEFVEIEPGFYINRDINEEPMIEALAFSDGPCGRVLLNVGSGSLIRVPWYESITFLGSLTVLALLMMTSSLVGWAVSWFIRYRRDKTPSHSLGERLARIVAVALSLLTIGFLAGLGYVLSDIDPAYGIPNIVLGLVTPLTRLVFALPWAILLMGIATILFAILAWVSRYWSLLVRVHYSLLALSVMGLFWVLIFTNLLI